MMVDLTAIAVVFTETVQSLCVPVASGKELFISTCNGKRMNFRHKDFDRALLKMIPADSKRHYMELFRDLGWIICGEKRFTNTQRIRGHTMRVISVDVMKYQLLKDLLKGKEASG